MALEQDQKEFIKAKVKELGSVQATKQLYNQDCKVDLWAIVYANKVYNKPRKFSS